MAGVYGDGQIIQFEAFGAVFHFYHQAVAPVGYRITPYLAVLQVDYYAEYIVFDLFVRYVGDFFLAFELGDPVRIAGGTEQVDIDPVKVYIFGNGVG